MTSIDAAAPRRLLMLVGLCGSFAADAASFNTVYSFSAADLPQGTQSLYSPPLVQTLSRLTLGQDGLLYGVSSFGGAANDGFVYQFNPTTGTLTHLHDFTGTDGANPLAALTQGADGNFYGTTLMGGANTSSNCDYSDLGWPGATVGCGVVYRISPSGSFTKLHDFYSSSDGYLQSDSVGFVLASDGSFYGIAAYVPPSNPATSSTAVYKMSSAGTISQIYQFPSDKSLGFYSRTPLVQGQDGWLYGTTARGGGSAYAGTLFKVSLGGQMQVLHQFAGHAAGDGDWPYGTLALAADGSLYGTTLYGGNSPSLTCSQGCGSVYKISSNGAVSILHSFADYTVDGQNPQGGLVLAPDGLLYGTTFNALNNYSSAISPIGPGTVFSVDPATGTTTLLQNFATGTNSLGSAPFGGVTLAADGNLYMPASLGGSHNDGAIDALLIHSANPVPAISSFSPAGGSVGSTVTLNGSHLSQVTKAVFATGIANPSYWTLAYVPVTAISDTQISAVVPANTASYAVGVVSAQGLSFSGAAFYLPPTITSLSPSSGVAGDYVTLSGRNFLNTTVTFSGNAVAAQPIDTIGASRTTDSMLVAIPAGAITGPIALSNAAGQGLSPTLTIALSAPAITSITPTQGTVGTVVTIYGSHFDQITTVSFNGGKASGWQIAKKTDGSDVMTVTVPSGAKTGAVTLTNASGSASSQRFTVKRR